MLKNSLMFLVIILLTACQHPPGWHKTLPAINFSPVKTVEMPREGYRGIFCSRSQCRYRRIYNN